MVILVWFDSLRRFHGGRVVDRAGVAEDEGGMLILQGESS